MPQAQTHFPEFLYVRSREISQQAGEQIQQVLQRVQECITDITHVPWNACNSYKQIPRYNQHAYVFVVAVLPSWHSLDEATDIGRVTLLCSNRILDLLRNDLEGSGIWNGFVDLRCTVLCCSGY